MHIKATSKWYKRHSAKPSLVDCNVYTARYGNVGAEPIALNISIPTLKTNSEKFEIRMTAETALKLADQLVRHANTQLAQNEISL
jgi:hypothetical protein